MFLDLKDARITAEAILQNLTQLRILAYLQSVELVHGKEGVEMIAEQMQALGGGAE